MYSAHRAYVIFYLSLANLKTFEASSLICVLYLYCGVNLSWLSSCFNTHCIAQLNHYFCHMELNCRVFMQLWFCWFIWLDMHLMWFGAHIPESYNSMHFDYLLICITRWILVALYHTIHEWIYESKKDFHRI